MNSDRKDFKVGDVWLDHNRTKVTLIRTDIQNRDFPLPGLVSGPDKQEGPRQYTAEGWYLSGGGRDLRRSYDLVKKYEEPVGPEEVRVFVNKTTGHLGYATAVGATILPQDSRKGWVLVKYRRVDEEG